MAGQDPVQALVEHDQGLAHLSPAEKSCRRLNNPSYPERKQGAKPDAIATHRFANTLERVEVRTTLDYLLRHADDIDLGRKVLDGCDRIISEFLEKPLPDAEDATAKVRIKEFEAAAKLAMRFYESSRQFMVKRESQGEEGETILQPGDRDAIAERLTLLNERATQIARLLASDAQAEVQSDAPQAADDAPDGETVEVELLSRDEEEPL